MANWHLEYLRAVCRHILACQHDASSTGATSFGSPSLHRPAARGRHGCPPVGLREGVAFFSHGARYAAAGLWVWQHTSALPGRVGRRRANMLANNAEAIDAPWPVRRGELARDRLGRLRASALARDAQSLTKARKDLRHPKAGPSASPTGSTRRTFYSGPRGGVGTNHQGGAHLDTESPPLRRARRAARRPRSCCACWIHGGLPRSARPAFHGGARRAPRRAQRLARPPGRLRDR